MKRLRCLAAAAAVAAVPAVSHAVATVDPAGDLLSTYPGPRGGDLDVVSTDVLYNGNSFRFTTTLAAPVGTTPGGFYIWGLDRGQGTARFGQFTVGGNTYDARGVLFDSVVILRPGGPSQVVDLVAGTPPTTLARTDGLPRRHTARRTTARAATRTIRSRCAAPLAESAVAASSAGSAMEVGPLPAA